MAIVTITLTDNPADHTVAVHSSFTPAVGGRVSPAQTAAMDIIMRTSRQWGTVKADALIHDPLAGIDIDAVHRTRDHVVAKV